MKQTIAGTEFRAEYVGDSKIIIHHKRGFVVRDGGKWVDDNKGKSYLNWQAREMLVKAFNLNLK